MPGNDSYDVVIVGGGVIGSSIAYFLTRNAGLRVAVVEPDPSYEWNATPRSAGGIRAQFSTAPNVMMSLYGVDFVRQVPDLLEVDGERPEVGFQERGYLVLATEQTQDQLRQGYALQRACGADTALLDPATLAARFPWLVLDDIAIGTLGESGEGWLDPYSLLQAFRRKAIAQGVSYIKDRVTALSRKDDQIRALTLQSGRILACGTLVNAAGTQGAQIAKMAGIPDLPVASRRRQIFVFDCRDDVPDMPMLVDPSGVYCRPEGGLYICGLCPDESDDPDSCSFDVDHAQFEQDIWPVLAARVPTFEAIKVVNAWAGHYDVNPVDHNAILGPHPEVSNFFFANGFSGHGLQQSPAVGRALSEQILLGRYDTLDLSQYRFARFAENDPIVESNVY